MAIGILGVLSLTGATLIYYSTSNAKSASASKGRETAYTLAEAGIAQALSVLNSSLNPLTGSLLGSTTIQLEGGSVTYSGTLSGETWTITSTGTVKNPTGSSNITRTLTRSAQVYGLNSGANVAAWNRWYADSTTSCLTINGRQHHDAARDARRPLPGRQRHDHGGEHDRRGRRRRDDDRDRTPIRCVTRARRRGGRRPRTSTRATTSTRPRASRGERAEREPGRQRLRLQPADGLDRRRHRGRRSSARRATRTRSRTTTSTSSRRARRPGTTRPRRPTGRRRTRPAPTAAAPTSGARPGRRRRWRHRTSGSA